MTVNDYVEEKVRKMENEQTEKMIYEELKSSMVNHPEHYNGDTPYECIKVLKAWLSPEEFVGFLKGNAIKYLCRVGKKDSVVQDLKKAKWYIDKLIESEEET